MIHHISGICTISNLIPTLSTPKKLKLFDAQRSGQLTSSRRPVQGTPRAAGTLLCIAQLQQRIDDGNFARRIRRRLQLLLRLGVENVEVFSGALPGAAKYLEGSLVGGGIEMLAILEVEQVSRSRLNENARMTHAEETRIDTV